MGKRKIKTSVIAETPYLMGLKFGIAVIFAAAVGLYFVKASDYSKPNLPETSASEQEGSCDNEAVINPCEDLPNWLSRAGPVSGYHVLCVARNGQSLTVYLRGKDFDATTRTLTPPEGVAWTDLSEAKLRPRLETAVNVIAERRDKNIRAARASRAYVPQAWRLFSRDGFPVDTFESTGIFLLFEGGQWVWPGIELGFQRTIRAHDRDVTIVTVSLKPLVVSVEDFLSENDCEHIIQTAGKHMKKSGVTLMDKDKGRAASDFRTSETWFMPSRGKQIKMIDRRVANLTRTRVNQQEQVQVLRYREHQRYSPHLDWFMYDAYKNDANMVKFIKGGYRNRMSTVFWYMNDPPKGTDGGETNFGQAQPGYFLPEMAAHPGGRGPLKDCRFGMSVRPKKGKVIIFYSLHADGTGDQLAQHSACPPEGKGALKWAANKWVWNEPMTYLRDQVDERSHAPGMKSL